MTPDTTSPIMLIGSLVGAWLTVPALNLLKQWFSLVDKAPPQVKQAIAPLIAWGLTWVGAQINYILPTDLALFTADTIQVGFAAGFAYAFHTGKKLMSRKG